LLEIGLASSTVPLHGVYDRLVVAFQSSKLVIDPYAQAIAGQVGWGADFAMLGHPEGDIVIEPPG